MSEQEPSGLSCHQCGQSLTKKLAKQQAIKMMDNIASTAFQLLSVRYPLKPTTKTKLEGIVTIINEARKWEYE